MRVVHAIARSLTFSLSPGMPWHTSYEASWISFTPRRRWHGWRPQHAPLTVLVHTMRLAVHALDADVSRRIRHRDASAALHQSRLLGSVHGVAVVRAAGSPRARDRGVRVVARQRHRGAAVGAGFTAGGVRDRSGHAARAFPGARTCTRHAG